MRTAIPTTEVNLSKQGADRLVKALSKSSELGYDVSGTLINMVRDYERLSKRLRELQNSSSSSKLMKGGTKNNGI